MANTKLAGVVEGLLRETGTPGVAVSLVVDGQSVLEAAFGSAGVEGMPVLDTDARFYIYSITKTLSAIATLQLAEQRRVDLDAPVQDHLPELSLPERVTVRQLLNHTGGIPDYGGMPEYHEAVRRDPGWPWSIEEFLERASVNRLAFTPGQGWGYSNIGYLIVRLLLERIHGGSLREVLAGAIFEPLGLRRTFVAEDLADTRTLTPGYSTLFAAGDALEDISSRYHPGWVSHGVVISTAPEIACIFEALFTGRLLSQPSLAAMLEPAEVPASHPLFRQPAYGLGLMIDAGSPYGVVAGHGGGGPGYSTGAIDLSDVSGRRVTSVALVNCDQGDLGLRIAFALAEQLGSSPV